MELQFFHRKWPVIGEPQSVRLPDTECKFWSFVAGALPALTVRTHKVGDAWSSLQERLDNFVWKEATGGNGLPLLYVTHVRPASDAEIKAWMESHDWIYG